MLSAAYADVLMRGTARRAAAARDDAYATLIMPLTF